MQTDNMAIRNLTDLLQDLQSGLNGERVSIDALLDSFHERGFGFILLLFSVPMAIPVPKPPGLSTFFALPLLLLTVQQVMGRHTVWLPKAARRRTLPCGNISQAVDHALPWAGRLEKFIKPRLGMMTQAGLSHLVGLAGVIMSLSIMMPLPGMNTVPAQSIVLMSVGTLMRDGVCILIGMVAGLAWVVMLSALYITFGLEGWNVLRSFIFG